MVRRFRLRKIHSKLAWNSNEQRTWSSQDNHPFSALQNNISKSWWIYIWKLANFITTKRTSSRRSKHANTTKHKLEHNWYEFSSNLKRIIRTTKHAIYKQTTRIWPIDSRKKQLIFILNWKTRKVYKS